MRKRKSMPSDLREPANGESVIRLSAKDSRLVAELLLNPPAPTEAARKAAGDYLNGRKNGAV